MGRLEYDSNRDPIFIDDATLAHIKIVVANKLRRQESFMMTWRPDPDSDARLCVWVHPAIPLLFAFDSTSHLKVDPARIEHWMTELNARGELFLDHDL